MTRTTPHTCTARCVCPVHQTRLVYSPLHDDHACQDPDCVYAHGMNPPLTWTCTNHILASDMSIQDPVERAANPVQRECGFTVTVVYAPDLPGNRDRHLADCGDKARNAP